MRQIYNLLTLLMLLLVVGQAQAQYPFTDADLSPFKQNFDIMSTGNVPFDANGTNSSMPGIIVGYNRGVFFPVPTLVPNDGSSSGSAAYNFGATNATDRALGGIAGGLAGNTGTGYISVRLRNTSNTTIVNLDVRYAIEQWYNSSLGTDAYFRAAYRKYSTTTAFNNNDIIQATGTNGWTAVPQLDLQAPATGGILGQVNGNSATYRRTAQYRLLNVNLAKNQEIVIRFDYVFSSATNGNGISMDDIVIYPETSILYASTTGNLNSTASGAGATWGLTSDGANPVGKAVDFSAPNVTYYVQGTNTASRLNGPWQITGDNSRIVVGTDASPASLCLASSDQVSAVMDVASGSTLKLACTPTGLTMGTMATNSTVEYASTSTTVAQNVLPATYAKLNFSGASLKSLTGDVTVAEALGLSSTSSSAPQAVQLGNNDLTMLRGATISRTNGGQVITNGTGEYRATVIGAGTSSTAVLFPVALSAAAADYLPVSITAGVNSAGNDLDETYNVRVISGVYAKYAADGTGSNPAAYTGNVNNTWHVGHETSTPVSATLKMGWATTREGSKFVRANSYLDHYTSSTNTWDASKTGSTFQGLSDGQYTVQRTGVTKFSPFALTSSPAGPLPVTLVAFDAKRVGTTVVCTWATASELYNDHFVVERSLDGTSFAALGTVAGNGTSSTAHTYTFVDAQPTAGVAYYRLRQVDTDGTASFSPVVVVQGGELASATITAVPNPSAGQFTLLANFPTSTQLRGTVVNMLGQRVLTVNEVVPAGAAALPLDLSAQPAGVYLVQLLGPAGPVSLRLLKQ